MKRKRFGWATVTVRGSDLEFLDVEGRYLWAGVRTTISKGRWIASNVLLIPLLVFIGIFGIFAQKATGNPFYWLYAIFGWVATLYELYLFAWSLSPPKRQVDQLQKPT